MEKEIKTVAGVIEALGGWGAMSRMFGVGHSTVSQWKTRGFPPETYVVMARALAERGLRASAKLWQMREAAE